MYGIIYCKTNEPLGMFEGFTAIGNTSMDIAINILLYLGYDVIIVKETTHAKSP